MSADLAARLRTLAQDYQDGRLNLAAYRSLRAPLLDSLVLNAPRAVDAMAVTQPRIAARPSVAARASESAPPQVQGGTKTPTGLIVAIIGLVAIAGAGLWFWTSQSPQGDGASVSTPAAEMHPVYATVRPFVDRGDWSDGRLAALNASLLELGGQRIGEVAREHWFLRFVDELRRRLKEQQALASTTLTADNSALAALAVTVGLDLNSPDAAIRIAAAEPTGASESSASASGAHGADGSASTAQHRAASPSSGAATSSGTERAAGAASVVSASGPASAEQSAGSSARAPSVGSQRSGAPESTTSAQGARAGSATETNAAPAASTCRLELIRSRRPLCQDTLPDGAEGPQLALIPAGVFDMGSSESSTEQPVHRVTIHRPFAISVYEVSQGEFAKFCAQTRRTCPAQPQSGDDYPVVNVTWDDARAYADWLSSVTRYRYSLPTEAQWEYAARAGQTGLVPSGDALSPTDAHFSMVAKQTEAARRAQKFNQNAFRLVHTVGNVREWVEDGWSEDFTSAPTDGSASPAKGALRVARGGSYADTAAKLRLSTREGLPEGTRDGLTGFRVVRELP